LLYLSKQNEWIIKKKKHTLSEKKENLKSFHLIFTESPF